MCARDSLQAICYDSSEEAKKKKKQRSNQYE